MLYVEILKKWVGIWWKVTFKWKTYFDYINEIEFNYGEIDTINRYNFLKNKQTHDKNEPSHKN